jgi:chemotaxis protein MotB
VKGYTGEINAMEAALAEAAAREARAAKRLAEYNSMLKQLKSMIDSGKLKVRIVRNKMVIELPEAVLFASGSAKLKTEGVRVLAELGPVLASIKGREFQVGGHTDNKPIRTKRFPSNWELSGARAIDVTQLLIEYGVPTTRVSAAAYADSQPVADNETKEGRALNRRIEIALQPNLDELPDLSSFQ